MEAVKVKENIYWVGAIDWDIRNFHGYLTQRGATYNAYLILDEKVTLVDTVKATHTEEMFERIASIIDPAEIDIVISNHVEPDHSGALPEVKKRCPKAEIYTSPSGVKGLANYYGDLGCKALKGGDTLSIGKRSFQFVLTPMVHWPDNMICYMPEEKILFSNDSFGQHYASSARFDDESPLDIVMSEAQKYFANIVLPFSKQVQKELEAASALDIQMICSSHGVIWRKHVKDIIEAYTKWATNYQRKKAVVVYDTMWKSTEVMARTLCNTFSQAGYETVLRPLQSNHESDVMTDVIDAEYICVGSPTLNNGIMPSVGAFLTYLKGLAPVGGRKAIVFGSHGWNGKSLKEIQTYMDTCKFDTRAVFKIQYKPTEQDLLNMKKELLEELGTPIEDPVLN